MFTAKQPFASPVIVNRGVSIAHRMNATVDAALQSARSVAYLGYPTYMNVGDLLIMLGTLEYFRSRDLELRLAGTLGRQTSGVKVASDVDALVLQGGGNFGDIYPEHQDYREAVIAANPDRRIVILPQTIHFESKARLEQSMKVLDRHQKLILIARDKRSHEEAVRYLGRERVMVAPDMAHQLAHSIELVEEPEVGEADPLFFVRRDCEGGDIPISLAARAAEFEDWGTVNTVRLKCVSKIAQVVTSLFDLTGERLKPHNLYFQQIASAVWGVARAMNKHPVWITSRLHGVILAILLGKPVYALDNSYGKLSDYISSWLEELAPAPVISTDADAEFALRVADSLNAGLSPAAMREMYLLKGARS